MIVAGERLRVLDDHTNDSLCLVRLREAEHLLHALLDKSCEVNDDFVAGALHLVVLE